MTNTPTYDPLITVVITTFNHGRYIRQAIESVISQTYTLHEIIVVDDGSTDDTESILAGFGQVKYIHQQNQGLSAARNTGISHSAGEFLVFLDADDWLLPQALAVNLKILQEDPSLAFVAGAHQFYYTREKVYQPVVKEGGTNYYCRLLEGNFVAMHAAVMYRKWVFKVFSFDTSLKNCEDYDLYLKVVRKYPMCYHPEIIAVYRRHETNMSGDSRKMLAGALKVLDRHQDFTENDQELQCLARGRLNFTTYYMEQLEKDMYLRLFYNQRSISLDELVYLKFHAPAVYDRFMQYSLDYLLKNPGKLAVTGWRRLLPKGFLLKSI